jgi:acetyl-CoA synthetase
MKLACDFGLMGDYQPSDRLMWMSDFGWLVGPVLVFSSLLLGATIVMAEGAIDYPDEGRFWRLIAENQVTILGIAPTIVRSFMHIGGGGVEHYDLSSLRVSFSTGEPWTLSAWRWMFQHVCKTRVPIINMSGGTEIGGTILSGTVIHPIKPCAFVGSTLGMAADAVDENGVSVFLGEGVGGEGMGREGELVLRQPSPGLTRGLWQDPARYIESYWRKYPGLWCQSDRAAIDADGFWYLLGRSDDVLKIAGKRTSPTEIEALAVATGHSVEVAAIGVPDTVKGEAILIVARKTPGVEPDASTAMAISDAITKGLGTPFRPKAVLFVDDLPKTRSMKVMRRLVRSACLGQAAGDLSALVNPETIDTIRQAVKAQWPEGLSP